jgi:hypothetical protein
MLKKLTLIVILLLIGTTLLCRAEFLDYANNIGNFAVSVATHTNTEIRPANGDRRDLILINPSSFMIYVGYNVSMSTTTAFPLASNGTLTLPYYVGSVYGKVTSTDTVQTIRGIEIKY